MLRDHAQCLKIIQNDAFEFLAFSINIVLLKLTCLVTLFDRKLQVFKNSLKWTFFDIFELTFVHSKCKRCSLRSHCWMRLFLWFSTLWCYVWTIYRNLGKFCSFKQDSNCDWQASNTSFLSWFPRNPANKRQKLN